MQRVYLDNAATTPMHKEVIDTMTQCMQNIYGNPSSTHVFGREAKAQMELSRKKIAELLNVSPSEIVFTSCGTESNNFIIRSCVDHLGVTRIITSTLEHKCVQETVTEMEAFRNIEVVRVKLDQNGSVDYAELERILQSSDKKTLVTLMHANNEIGNLLDVEKVQQLCEQNNALFHTDTVQTLGHYPMDLSKLKIDFASCSAHKLHGPKGIGFAFVRKSLQFKPQITGGGQERNLRSGTENVYGVVGLAKAFEMSVNDLDKHRAHIEDLKIYTIQKLREEIHGVEFNGLSADLDKSLYTVLNVRLPFKDALIGFELELKGIAVSQGSACSSGASKVSTVIQSVLDAETIERTTPVRISYSCYNTREDIDTLVKVIKQISEKHLVPH